MFGHIQREFAVSEINVIIIKDSPEFCKRKIRKMVKNGIFNNNSLTSIQKYRQNDESVCTTVHHGSAAAFAAVPHQRQSAGGWCSSFFHRVFLRTVR